MTSAAEPQRRGGAPLADTGRPNSLSNRLRSRRDVRLRALIQAIADQSRPTRILDIGGTVQYWERVGFEFLRRHRAHVTVLNVVSDIKSATADFESVSLEIGDGCNLNQYADRAFDLTHSNSVIEHVGDWSRMKQFAKESRRVAKNYYIQTPSFWFPIDPHYYKAPMIHWMPRPLRVKLLTTFSITHAGKVSSLDSAHHVLDSTRLLDERQFRFLFPDAEIFRERIAGLTKSLIAIRRGGTD